ncbi:hypothetical protein [Sulfurimonas sp.]
MDLKQFLELFNPLPGNHYLLVTDKVDEVTNVLAELMQGVNGEFHLALYENEITTLQDKLQNTKLQSIQNISKPFRALPRDHDIVIIKDIMQIHKNPELLLRIAYTTLANTAEIIIMQKKGTMDVQKMKELLEKLEFRTPNEIDIVAGYDLVMAKKMHMWGNGL